MGQTETIEERKRHNGHYLAKKKKKALLLTLRDKFERLIPSLSLRFISQSGLPKINVWVLGRAEELEVEAEQAAEPKTPQGVGAKQHGPGSATQKGESPGVLASGHAPVRVLRTPSL